MIVCHCNSIADRDIHAAVDWMRAADPDTVITPGKVYRALGKRADCGGCLSLFLETMSACDSFQVPPALDAPKRARKTGDANEGRRQGHRVPQQGAQE